MKIKKVKFLEDFKAFINRGNIVDMAVGVIVGTAFGKITTSLVNDIVMPAVGLIIGKIDIKGLKWVITEANEAAGIAENAIRYGAFLQGIIDFLILAFTVFVFIRLFSKLKRKEPEVIVEPAPEPEPTPEQLLLTEIRDLLKEKKEN